MKRVLICIIILFKNGRGKVTGIDTGFTCRIRDDYAFDFIQGDFINWNFTEQYDLVWRAHVLEHQLAVGIFI